MWLTPPERPEDLTDFYKRVRPYGWWKPVQALCPGIAPADRFADDASMVGLGLVFCYSSLFALGGLLLGWWGIAVGSFALAAVCSVFLIRRINHVTAES